MASFSTRVTSILLVIPASQLAKSPISYYLDYSIIKYVYGSGWHPFTYPPTSLRAVPGDLSIGRALFGYGYSSWPYLTNWRHNADQPRPASVAGAKYPSTSPGGINPFWSKRFTTVIGVNWEVPDPRKTLPCPVGCISSYHATVVFSTGW